MADGEATTARRAGRQRDPSRDAAMLDATLLLLAESGYDGLTIDKVAAQVGAARATVYRRWPTKADLALDAVAHLSRHDVAADALPDTGTFRGDLVAMILPQSAEDERFRMRVLAGLAALTFADDPRLGAAAIDAGLRPWTAAIGTLMQRALDRGEFPPADVATLAAVIPMACLARAVTGQPITREFSLTMIDSVLLPALRGGR